MVYHIRILWQILWRGTHKHTHTLQEELKNRIHLSFFTACPRKHQYTVRIMASQIVGRQGLVELPKLTMLNLLKCNQNPTWTLHRKHIRLDLCSEFFRQLDNYTAPQRWQHQSQEAMLIFSDSILPLRLHHINGTTEDNSEKCKVYHYCNWISAFWLSGVFVMMFV